MSLFKKTKFIKTIYIDLWESEYDIYLINNEYYLVANKNTDFRHFPKDDFREKHNLLVYPLCRLINHNIKPKDVHDIVCYRDVLCYVVKTDDDAYYRMLPAIGGCGMAVDAAYISIGNWGDPTFIKFSCRDCGVVEYYDTQHIPQGARYEKHCPKCNYHEWRKKI